jgi:hypothetical protein
VRYFVVIGAAVVLSFSWIAWTHTTTPLTQTSQAARETTTRGEKLEESWAKDQKLLAAYEQEQSKLRAEVIKRRRLYQDGQIPKAEVTEAEQAFVRALTRVHDVRRSMMASDMAIAEAAAHEELERMPVPTVNGVNETDHLARFNGGTRWSLKDAQGIDKFFFQNFGQHLPVTAYGQTTTHNQLHFDHRGSMDVALHPDSLEGKALINHLRSSGIPFIAFRGRVAGASTGAHIHIGQPSHRTAAN